MTTHDRGKRVAWFVVLLIAGALVGVDLATLPLQQHSAYSYLAAKLEGVGGVRKEYHRVFAPIAEGWIVQSPDGIRICSERPPASELLAEVCYVKARRPKSVWSQSLDIIHEELYFWPTSLFNEENVDQILTAKRLYVDAVAKVDPTWRSTLEGVFDLTQIPLTGFHRTLLASNASGLR